MNENTDFQKIAALREETRDKNAAALIAVMQEYDITIVSKDFNNWRPTARASGTLAGLDAVGNVVILCTDGVVAHFLLSDGVSTLHGHTSNFSGEVKPLFTLPKKNHEKVKPVSKRKRVMAMI